MNQFVRCCVIESTSLSRSDDRKSLVLSMRSSLFNRHISFKHLTIDFPLYGCISSIEDHGYVVQVGITACTAFLPIKEVSKNTTLVLGTIFSIDIYILRTVIHVCTY
jgi:rRNA biogenesis protein RRP5